MIVARNMAVATGIEKSERDGEESKKVNQAELATRLPHGMCNIMYIWPFLCSKYDLRF